MHRPGCQYHIIVNGPPPPPELEGYDRSVLVDDGGASPLARPRTPRGQPASRPPEMSPQPSPGKEHSAPKSLFAGAEMARELRFKFAHWDRLVDKRSLLKYEQARTPAPSPRACGVSSARCDFGARGGLGSARAGGRPRPALSPSPPY